LARVAAKQKRDGYPVNYLYFCVGSVVVVENLGQTLTTPENARALLSELEREGIDLRRTRIIYRNADGNWARILPPSACSTEMFGSVFPVYSAQFRRVGKTDGQE
jgi:hypothetical protein